LVDTKGLDLDVLYCETLKLFDYTDGEITIEDVKECCIPVFERTVWELIEQLNRQRFDEACRYVEEFINDMMSLIPSKRHGVVEQTLGALSQNFELLVHAKDKCRTPLTYNAFWDGIDGLKRLKEKEWVDKFSKGLCFAKLKDAAFQSAHGWPKAKIYGAWLLIRHLHPRLRFEPENMQCGLTAICMYVCGKINERQALLLGGYAPDEVCEIVGGAV
jgi:hypothetical protein